MEIMDAREAKNITNSARMRAQRMTREWNPALKAMHRVDYVGPDVTGGPAYWREVMDEAVPFSTRTTHGYRLVLFKNGDIQSVHDSEIESLQKAPGDDSPTVDMLFEKRLRSYICAAAELGGVYPSDITAPGRGGGNHRAHARGAIARLLRDDGYTWTSIARGLGMRHHSPLLDQAGQDDDSPSAKIARAIRGMSEPVGMPTEN